MNRIVDASEAAVYLRKKLGDIVECLSDLNDSRKEQIVSEQNAIREAIVCLQKSCTEHALEQVHREFEVLFHLAQRWRIERQALENPLH